MSNQFSGVSRSMPAIAKMVAATVGVKTFFDAGSTPYADKNGIHLPKTMKAVGSDRDAILLNAYLDHEAAHVRYSDFDLIGLCRSAFEKTVLNIIEDARIERQIGIALPGCKRNLAAAAQVLDTSTASDAKDASGLITGYLSTMTRKVVVGQEIVGAASFDAAIRKQLGNELVSEIEVLAVEGGNASDAKGAFDAAQKLVDLLKQAQQQAKDQAQQKSESQDQDSSESDDQGQGPSESQDQDESQGQGAGGRSSESVTDEELAQMLEEALSEEGEDLFAKQLREAMRSMGQVPSDQQVETEFVAATPVGDGKYSSENSDAACRIVAGKLDHLLWSRTQKQRFTASQGRLVASRLSTVVTHANTRVFDKTTQADGLNTALAVLVDVSGSMGYYRAEGSARQMACDAAAAVAKAVERFEGIKCAISAFDELIHPVKSFDQRWAKVGNKLQATDFGTGGTSMGAAHAHGIGLLANRRENRRILLVVTDGVPGNFPALEASVQEAAKHGLETRFVLIHPRDGMKTHFVSQLQGATSVSQAKDAKGIPDAILTALQGGKGL